MIGRVLGAIRLWWSPRRVQAQGSTPDYRFSLANERTFLAWVRTALALVAGGIAADQFLTELRWGVRTTIALLLLIGGAMCAIRAVNHWARVERAMRLRKDLPISRFPALLALGTVLTALIVVVVMLMGWTDR